MEWINKPQRLDNDTIVELGVQVVDSNDTKKSIIAFIRGDFLELLQSGMKLDKAHGTLWKQYVELYNLQSVKNPKTREERADKTRYNTFYVALDRVKKAFQPITYAGREVLPAINIADLWKDAEFNGSMNFDIVLLNLSNTIAHRNKIMKARIDQLDGEAHIARQIAEKERFDAAVAAAIAAKQ